ncbi:capsular polysaccharide export protein, LipB/KpsS family [Paraburkholderia tropica]|uniref:Capsular polysaccharide export protein n=1 Tax=Paraburkholderia tropica TaxID=92647 RepID=A0AAQ1JXB7_9BURK|nr:hypothetical protein [Paraburkholderia tropica]QNB12245.1 capsular biosynthesis protein [Paraburkholderia tropica]RQN36682.1 capsular biosynthesis protein [Paraburkholderia tropica]SEK11575.1 capsular polysaccharide export protein [Paraburkholderia tropica]
MIVIVIDSLERARFFLRVAAAARNRAALLFLTSEPLAFLMTRASGYQSIYLHRPALSSELNHEAIDASLYGTAIEVLNGDLPIERAQRDASAMLARVTSEFARFEVERCLIWNGQQLVGRVVASVCRSHSIPVRFLEISNLPDKLFVDPLGVNAQSSIANDTSIIDRFPAVDRAEHDAWLAHYESYKARPLPQARRLTTHRIASTVNYAIKSITSGVVLRQRVSRGMGLVSGFADAQRIALQELLTRNYVFLPLQVSGDTQIQLNSDVDNLQAIELAQTIARQESRELLVKLHPAERNRQSIADVIAKRDALGFQLVDNPTIELLKHAARVVTINSTVGLEALLYSKPVTCLGRAVYRDFDEARLLKYIHRFLVDGIDYFGHGPIPPAAAVALLGLPTD